MKNLIKTIEFIFILSFSAIGWIVNGFSEWWALILFGGYLAINLTGWSTKSLNDISKTGEGTDPNKEEK